MSIEWYYKLMGEEVGPLSAAELRQHALQGRLTPDTYVRRGDSDRWLTADAVGGLLSKPESRSVESRAPMGSAATTSDAFDAYPSRGALVEQVVDRSHQVAEPLRPPSVRLTWIGAGAITSLGILAVLVVVLQASREPDIKISDIFRGQLMKFLEASGELDAATDQGVNMLTFRDHLAKVKASYELASATWPEAFEPDARQSFDAAITGWELALELFDTMEGEYDPPTEPDINGYARYMAYAGSSLETGKWGKWSPVREYVGRRTIYLNSKNVGVLCALASMHCKSGKAKVLMALAQKR